MENNKTAINQAIDNMHNAPDVFRRLDMNQIAIVKEYLRKFLKQEKQQIVDAYDAGKSDEVNCNTRCISGDEF